MSGRKTILYIEDDEVALDLVQRVLTHAGYKVLVARRATLGLELVRRYHPDLILTDINLPDVSGRELTARLRADPQSASIPIVALTAQVQPGERNKTYAAGVTGYITKPVDIPSLIQHVEEYLQGKQDSVRPPAPVPPPNVTDQELVKQLESNVRELEVSIEELSRIDRIKDDFIQLTAHELRTPLTTVYGYSRLVQTSPAIQQIMTQNPEVQTCLQGLVDSIERMHAVVSEIIIVSRIASGRLDLKLGPTNLRDIIQGVVNEYSQVVQQRNLKLIYDSSEWPSQFYADTALLELAFSNILGNAIKYTPDQGTITLRAKSQEGQVRISVKDTGIGIDPEDQKYIFNRFYTAGDTQLHSTSKIAFRGGGLGLGLAICQGIVKAHGGRIWVESEGCDVNRLPGSTFYIELPLQSSAASLSQWIIS